MKIPLLDHGYVEFIESWGHGKEGKSDMLANAMYSDDDEVGIIEAARMSTNKGFEGWGRDSKLLAYLYNNRHMTPFEMAGMTIEVKAPIFVFREWHRHRTQSYNEMSARYIPLPDENYLPTVERCMAQGGANKQAQGVTEGLTAEEAGFFRDALRRSYYESQHDYEVALECGIPKELARLFIPVARYSRMRASANLRNWLAFLTLRQDPAAQWEIRQYANAVAAIIAEQFPMTAALFERSKK